MAFEINLPFLNPRTLEKQKMVCLNCETEISTRITRDYTTEMCLGNAELGLVGCGCLLWYPPRPDRPYGVRKFISREEHLHKKYIDREKFIKEMKQRGIDVNDKVLQTSKMHRSLTHENNIEKGFFKENEKKFDEKIKEERENIEHKNIGFAKR